QPGNQLVIDELLARGVKLSDEHALSPKLRQALDDAKILAAINIPKLTARRAEQMTAAFSDIEKMLAAPLHQLVTAGLPNDTAVAFVLWRDDEENSRLLRHTTNSARQMRLELAE